jgi:hypothetical protein
MPDGCQCVKIKWAFEVNSQVPVLNFNDSFAPVVNEVKFPTLLVAMLIWNLRAKIFDVETAFLHGDLKEEISMEIPEGIDAVKVDGLSLNKIIYGLVQSSRR